MVAALIMGAGYKARRRFTVKPNSGRSKADPESGGL